MFPQPLSTFEVQEGSSLHPELTIELVCLTNLLIPWSASYNILLQAELHDHPAFRRV